MPLAEVPHNQPGRLSAARRWRSHGTSLCPDSQSISRIFRHNLNLCMKTHLADIMQCCLLYGLGKNKVMVWPGMHIHELVTLRCNLS